MQLQTPSIPGWSLHLPPGVPPTQNPARGSIQTAEWESYQVATYRCRTPTLKFADVSAWRPPKLQRYGATRYQYDRHTAEICTVAPLGPTATKSVQLDAAASLGLEPRNEGGTFGSPDVIRYPPAVSNRPWLQAIEEAVGESSDTEKLLFG